MLAETTLAYLICLQHILVVGIFAKVFTDNMTFKTISVASLLLFVHNTPKQSIGQKFVTQKIVAQNLQNLV